MRGRESAAGGAAIVERVRRGLSEMITIHHGHAPEIELLGAEGLTYDDWTMRREGSSDYTRGAGYRFEIPKPQPI